MFIAIMSSDCIQLTCTPTHIHTYRETHRHTDRHTHTQTDRHTHRQTDTDTHTDRQTDLLQQRLRHDVVVLTSLWLEPSDSCVDHNTLWSWTVCLMYHDLRHRIEYLTETYIHWVSPFSLLQKLGYILSNFNNFWKQHTRKICNKNMHVYPPHLFTVLIPYLVKIMIYLPVFALF